MKAWSVYLNGVEIDTVFYTEGCDAEYIKQSLVNHDGYDSGIVVQRLNEKYFDGSIDEE